MKQTLILFLSVVFSVYTYGQNSFESELIGKWSVENVQVNTSGLSEAQIKYVDSIKSAYDNAVFQFKENTDFNIIIDFKEISDRLQKSCWKYEAKESKIFILDCNEKYSKEVSWEFPLKITTVNQKIFFNIEPLFILEMKKEDH